MRRRMIDQTLSAGLVGIILGVATRTVCGWIDAGHLPGWRIPGSTHRRVDRQQLEAWLREQPEAWQKVARRNLAKLEAERSVVTGQGGRA